MNEKKYSYKKHGLRKSSAPHHAREFLDFDYIDKLSQEERDFLAKFSAEYYQSRFTNDGRDSTEPRTQARRDEYNRNNARYRDLWNRRKRTQELSDDPLITYGSRQVKVSKRERDKMNGDDGDEG